MTIAFPRLRSAQDAPPSEVAAPAAEPAPLETPADAGPLPAGHALTKPDGGNVNVFTQCLMFTRHQFRAARRRAREASNRDGNWVSDALDFKPRSINEQRAHLANRGWLPPGHEGGIADRAGEAYQVAYGIPGVAAANALGWTFKGGYRFALVTAVLLVALFAGCKFVLWLPFGTSAAVPGILAAILAGWLVLVAGVLAGRRAFARWKEN